MNTLTAVQLAKWKRVFAETGIHYETDAEYEEAIANLIGYFDVLIQMDSQQGVGKR